MLSFDVYQHLLVYEGMAGLTHKQQRVLSYIEKTVAEAGRPPTIREIAAYLDVTVKSAYQHVTALDRKGVIKRGTGHRGIVFRTQGVPILGKIAAGTPVLAEENIDGRLTFDDILRRKDDEKLFLLRVNGDSINSQSWKMAKLPLF